jgi:glycosyltransferase involved in cell wall biosynthesis
MSWPKITLVTAVYNGEEYLEATMRSIVNQEYPNLEYIVVDDGSTDGTAEIIGKYEKELAGWVRRGNRGMYASLNEGFHWATGEIMGWLNADDKLHTKALFVVGSVFRDLQEVEWITGRPTCFNETGMTFDVGEPPRWGRHRFLAGANRYIQQESTFWRRGLWEKAGGYVDDSGKYGHVSDFELWLRFFRHAKLYPVNALIGGFRVHDGSRGLRTMEECHRLQEMAVEEELRRVKMGKALLMFRAMGRAAKKVRGLRTAWWKLVERPLYHRAGRDCAPVIGYDAGKGWVLR